MTKLSELSRERQDKTVEIHVMLQLAIAELQDCLDLYEQVVDDRIDATEAAQEAEKLVEKHRLDDGTMPSENV